MPIKIFHTSDIHLGMKFNNYPDQVKSCLSEARFEVLEHMICMAGDLKADIFVIAGDLFNAIQLAKRDISRAASILNKFEGSCLLVLPGNHDYDNGAIDLWKDFSQNTADNILLLNEERPYNLRDYDLDVTVYPAPCHSKHSTENSLGWIKDEGLTEDEGFHIGIGHGSLEGLSPDMEGNYYYMSMGELGAIPVDLWLMGHTHVNWPMGEKVHNHKIFNAGTPEPDGMDYKGEGSAWFIELMKDKVSAEMVATGNYRFIDDAYLLQNEDDFDRISDQVLKDCPEKKAVRLSLSGNISKEAYDGLGEFYSKLEKELFYLDIEDSKLKIKISDEIISREFREGSFPHEFLKGLMHDEEALQMAYDLLGRD